MVFYCLTDNFLDYEVEITRSLMGFGGCKSCQSTPHIIQITVYR